MRWQIFFLSLRSYYQLKIVPDNDRRDRNRATEKFLLRERVHVQWIDFCMNYLQKKVNMWLIQHVLLHAHTNFLNSYITKCSLLSALSDLFLWLHHKFTILSLCDVFTNILKCLGHINCPKCLIILDTVEKNKFLGL